MPTPEQEPGWFERQVNRAERAIGRTVQDVAGVQVGDYKLGEKAVNAVLKTVEKIDEPNREVASPNLTAAIMALNPEYRKQNPGLDDRQLFEKAKYESKRNTSAFYNEQESVFRRSISRGRASIGVAAAYFPGRQKVDDIDWSDINEVESLFSTGKYRFASGLVDAYFTVKTDPLYILTRFASTSKTSALTRPIGQNKKGFTRLVPQQNITKASTEIDDAAAGVQNGFAPYLQAIREAKDIEPIIRFSWVQNSANPGQLATALFSAYKYGGDAAVADVAKVAIGNIGTFEKLSTRADKLSVVVNKLTNRLDAVEDELTNFSKINGNTGSRLNLSKKKIDEITAYNEEQLAQKKILDEKKLKLDEELRTARGELKNLQSRVGVVERAPEKGLTTTGTETLLGVANTTWSKFNRLERIRATAAQVDADGYWSSVDPLVNTKLAEEVSNRLGVSKTATRMAYWLSPNAQIGEVPAGVAYLDGIPSNFLYKEVNARLRQALKVSTMTSAQAREWSRLVNKTVTAAERYKLLDDIDYQVQKGIIEKEFPELVSKLSPTQLEALDAFVKHILSETKLKRSEALRDIFDKNYALVDEANGSVYAAKAIEEQVNTLALIRAQRRGSNKASQQDIDAVKALLKENPMFVTQQPNIHYSLNMQDVSNVVKENKLSFRGFLEDILENNLTAEQINKMISDYKKLKSDSQTGLELAGDFIVSKGKQGFDRLVDTLDMYQTYIWKPTTLFSLKYTTRNVFEGYLRVITSMMQMNSEYDYSWTRMLGSFMSETPGAPVRFAQNVGLRGQSRLNSARLNKINRKLAIQERDARYRIGPMSGATKEFAQDTINKRVDELSEEAFLAHDTVTLPITAISGKVSNITSHLGTKKDQAAARIVIKSLGEVGNFRGLTAKEKRLAKLLIARDYNLAYKESLTMNAGEISKALDHINTNFQKMAKKLDAIDQETLSPGIAREINELVFYIDRLDSHIDAAKVVFVEKDKLTGKFIAAQEKISVKPNLKGKYQGKLKIAEDVYIGKGFAGDAGELLMDRTSARSSNIRMLQQENTTTGFHILHDGYDRRNVDINEPAWVAAQSEYVNNILMKDALANKMIKDLAAGKSLKKVADEAKKWLTSDDGTAKRYRREEQETYKEFKKVLGTNKAAINAMVKEKLIDIEVNRLPRYDELGNEIVVNGKTLQQLAADGEFTPAVAANIPGSVRNPVLATVERKSFDALIRRNIVNAIFHLIGTLPEDHLIRHPFYSMVHDNEARRLANVIRNQVRSNPNNKNLSKSELDELVNNTIALNKDKIKRTANTRAYKELMQRMYSVERYTDFGSLVRFVQPFYMAHQNSSRYWLGTSLRNPEIAVLMAKAYNAPFRIGMVEDEEGNKVFSSNPWSPDRLTAVIGLKETGYQGKLRQIIGQDEIAFDPKAVDVITQGQVPVIPTAGGAVGTSLVTIGIGLFDVDNFVKKYFDADAETVINRYVMPFYQKTRGQNVFETLFNNFDPRNSWMVSALAAIYKGDGGMLNKESNIRFNSRVIAAYDRIALNRALNGQAFNHEEMRTEAINLAVRTLWAEALGSFFGPVVSPKFRTSELADIEAELNRLRKVHNGDTDAAALDLTIEIEKKYNTQYAPTISRLITTRSTENRLGLLSTPETLKNLNDNKALIEQIDFLFPDRKLLGEMLSAGDPTQDYSVFVEDKLFATKLNDKPLRSSSVNYDDRAKQQQNDMAWEVYFSNIEYIEQHAKARGISKNSDYYKENYKPWKESVTATIEKQFPLWATRDKTLDLEKTNVNLAIIDRMLNDKQYMSTVGKDSELVKGLQMYLEAREVFKAQLEIEGNRTGVYGADTNQNRWILDWRDEVVNEIIRQNPAFERVWVRYLNNDVLEDIPTFEELDKGL